MLANRTKVLLILSQDVVDRARVLAGRMTTTLKLPVSLQIVLRVLIEAGLKQEADPVFVASVEGHAQAVRQLRIAAGKRVRPGAQNTRRAPAHRRRLK